MKPVLSDDDYAKIRRDFINTGDPSTQVLLELVEQAVLARVAERLIGKWIPVSERLPELKKLVVVFVSANRYGEDDEGNIYCADVSGIDLGECCDDLLPDSNAYMTSFASPHGDEELITHWLELTEPTLQQVESVRAALTNTPNQQD